MTIFFRNLSQFKKKIEEQASYRFDAFKEMSYYTNKRNWLYWFYSISTQEEDQ
jgi:hypothetical protein